MVLLSNFSKLRFLNKSNNNRPKNSTFASGNQFENKNIKIHLKNSHIRDYKNSSFGPNQFYIQGFDCRLFILLCVWVFFLKALGSLAKSPL